MSTRTGSGRSPGAVWPVAVPAHAPPPETSTPIRARVGFFKTPTRRVRGRIAQRDWSKFTPSPRGHAFALASRRCRAERARRSKKTMLPVLDAGMERDGGVLEVFGKSLRHCGMAGASGRTCLGFFRERRAARGSLGGSVSLSLSALGVLCLFVCGPCYGWVLSDEFVHNVKS